MFIVCSKVGPLLQGYLCVAGPNNLFSAPAPILLLLLRLRPDSGSDLTWLLTSSAQKHGLNSYAYCSREQLAILALAKGFRIAEIMFTSIYLVFFFRPSSPLLSNMYSIYYLPTQQF